MTGSFLRRLLVVGVILALPVTGSAQEATLSGTVTDSTGGVLPGVTVTAVHEASGNTLVLHPDVYGRRGLWVRVAVATPLHQNRVVAVPGDGGRSRSGHSVNQARAEAPLIVPHR